MNIKENTGHGNVDTEQAPMADICISSELLKRGSWHMLL